MTYDDLTPSHHRLPEEGADDWSVISVVDAYGGGSDVAFTDGLYRFGVPELVLWARPTEGPDPGADWLLSHDDRITALDGWACDLIDGALAPGDTAQRGYDEGHATASFRFSAPMPAQQAGPLDLPPERPVIVAGWSLTRRAPARPARPADPGSPGVRRVHRWISRAQSITANWRQSPGGGRSLALAPSPSRFGPMTDWVQARIDQVLAAGEPVLAEYFQRVPVTALVRCEHCVHDELVSLACRQGRGGAAREAQNAAGMVAMALTDGPGPAEWSGGSGRSGRGRPGSFGYPATGASPAWRAISQEVSAMLHSLPPHRVEQVMHDRLTSNLESLLLAAAVGDVAPPALMASACGAWEWAVHGGRVPGRAWLAPASARQQVRQFVTGPDGGCLLPAAAPAPAWPGRGPGRGPGPASWWTDRTTAAIAGLQTVAAASARPGWLLTPDQRRPLTRAQVRALEALAAPLLTAVALPGRMDQDVWQTLTAPLRAHLPKLPADPPGGSILDLGRI